MKKKYIVLPVAAAVVVASGIAGVQTFKAIQAESSRAVQCEAVRAVERQVGEERAAIATHVPEFVVLGDSYAQGMGLEDPLDAYPYLLDDRPLVNGSGGSGYLSDGPCDDALFIDRLSSVLASEPEVLLIQGGINDRSRGDVETAAGTLFDAAKSVSPETRIVVIGPFAPAAVAGTDLDAVRDGIRRAALERSLDFIDPASWEFTVQDDGLHPNASGHVEIASAISEALWSQADQ